MRKEDHKRKGVRQSGRGKLTLNIDAHRGLARAQLVGGEQLVHAAVGAHRAANVEHRAVDGDARRATNLIVVGPLPFVRDCRRIALRRLIYCARLTFDNVELSERRIDKLGWI